MTSLPLPWPKMAVAVANFEAMLLVGQRPDGGCRSEDRSAIAAVQVSLSLARGREHQHLKRSMACNAVASALRWTSTAWTELARAVASRRLLVRRTGISSKIAARRDPAGELVVDQRRRHYSALESRIEAFVDAAIDQVAGAHVRCRPRRGGVMPSSARSSSEGGYRVLTRRPAKRPIFSERSTDHGFAQAAQASTRPVGRRSRRPPQGRGVP